MSEKSKEELREYQKQWAKNNPEKVKESRRKWRKNNLEKVKELNKQYRKNNLEKLKEKSKQYYKDNLEKRSIYIKQWQKDNIEKVREKQKEYRKNNLEKIKKLNEQWHKNNPEKVREYQKQWHKNNPKYMGEYERNRRKTDIKYNLNRKMSFSIWNSLKCNKAGWAWESLTGYTLADLKRRLNKTMPVGYTWQDYLSGELHIDHIIPISVFNFTRPEHNDFKRCWALSNLRLLPARENLIKHAKLDKPFQPALRI